MVSATDCFDFEKRNALEIPVNLFLRYFLIFVLLLRRKYIKLCFIFIPYTWSHSNRDLFLLNSNYTHFQFTNVANMSIKVISLDLDKRIDLTKVQI